MHGHVTPLVTEYFGNYTLQDLLGATQAFRLAAAKLRAEGKTSPQALEKLVGLRDGTDALGAARSSSPSALRPAHPGLAHHKVIILCLAQYFSLPVGLVILTLPRAHQSLCG